MSTTTVGISILCTASLFSQLDFERFGPMYVKIDRTYMQNAFNFIFVWIRTFPLNHWVKHSSSFSYFLDRIVYIKVEIDILLYVTPRYFIIFNHKFMIFTRFWPILNFCSLFDEKNPYSFFHILTKTPFIKLF